MLIADDQPVNRRLFVLVMEKLGVEILEAGDGLEALEKAGLHPNMIFMDLEMPRMNGWEAAAELRRGGFSGPLIAVTGGVFEDDEARCGKAGFDDVLFKPFSKHDLEALFYTWMNCGANTAAERAGALRVDGARANGTARTSAAGAASQASPFDVDGGGARVFDREKLIDTFARDTANAKTLLSHFLERCTMQIDGLPVFASEQNWTEAFRISHSIKGSARMLSGAELGNVAELLERACRNADILAIETLSPLLAESYTRFKNAAEEFIQS